MRFLAIRGWHSLPAALCVLAAGVAPHGCGDDETNPPDVGPTGDPKVTITLPREGDCVAVGEDAGATIPISFAVEQLLLRPPGACGAYAQCGYAQVLRDGVYNNRGSGPVVDLLIADLADRYVEDLEVRVEIVAESTGKPMLDHEDKPVAATIHITTAKECIPGTGGAGGTAGAGGAGGTGGSGGGGGAGGSAGGAGGTGGAGGAGGQGGG